MDVDPITVVAIIVVAVLFLVLWDSHYHPDDHEE